MKNHIALLLLLLPLLVASQTCEEKIAIAKSTKARGDYRLALKQFNAAVADCGPAKSGEAEKQILDIYDKIDALKKEADKQAKIAATKEAEATKQKTRAEAVLNKIYFYQDRFGLAYDKEKQAYGFIDKQLNIKIDFKYDEALPFDEFGFAKVTRYERDTALSFDPETYEEVIVIKQNRLKSSHFLIDSSGNQYVLADEFDKLDSMTEALDLRYKNLARLPEVWRQPRLKCLLLTSTQLKDLRPEIGKLNQLVALDLRNNELQELPAAIGDLRTLKDLYIGNNQLQHLPASIGNLTGLESLDLYSNHLAELPPEFGRLTKLERLDLQFNDLATVHRPALARSGRSRIRRSPFWWRKSGRI